MEPESSPSESGASFLRSCFNGLNALAGIGILTIPYALAGGGWFSLVLFMAVAIACLYTGVLLKRCMDANSFVRTYTDIGELAFGRRGRVFVATILYLELYLVAISFLILEGDNLDKLFPTARFRVAGLDVGGKQGFVLLAALLVLPTVWMRNLRMLAYVSFGGVAAFVVLVVCVVWAGTFDGEGFHGRDGSFLEWSGVPTAVSLYVFCYGGHAVFPTIYTSMKDRTQFFRVLVICFILCTLCYGSMAVIGYLMYGQHLQSQITLNLPTKNLSSKIAIYTTLVNPITKYALLITPVANAIEELFELSKHRLFSILLRTLLVMSTAILALTLPFFGYLTALTGSFLSCTASIVLPCVCYLKIFKNSRTFGAEQIVIYVIVAGGVLIATVGTFFSCKQIVMSF